MYLARNIQKSLIEKNVKILPPATIYNSQIGSYSYIATNSYIAYTNIGKFCSIGPNLTCGRGVHPVAGISTSPMFYSTGMQNGVSFCSDNKIDETPMINIGNDVFIGANVTIINGVTIGDGAIIGAGAVVSKDIPPYAVAVGCPIQIKRYRFLDSQIRDLLTIKWWNMEEEQLHDVEKMFFEVDSFIEKYRQG